MDTPKMIHQMERNAHRIAVLIEGVTIEQARWKPALDTWSLLEVINHLLDEEREDFRVRLNICLYQPTEAWPPIDPPGWVISRHYNERELGQSLENYLEERNSSLSWLKNLNAPDWNTLYEAPFGRISAGDLFASWVMHDLLHMRQLVELHRAYLEQLAAPFSLDYAGEW